jgi:dTDP-4-amino-4,6-dideoxy-D-galactose acyltransferase
MNNVEFLEFDTRIFGFKVAKILPSKIKPIELQNILEALRLEEVKLVYWASDEKDENIQKAAAMSGVLADRKVTYFMTVEQAQNNLKQDSHITEYCHTKPNNELLALAFTVGENSRFKTDKRISEAVRKNIYGNWMENSTNHKIANHVLVYSKDNVIAGMITLGEKNNRGDIGLLAVNKDYQGLGIGSSLVFAAQKQFIKKGYKNLQVVTQIQNTSACRLYERCGYVEEKVENFYHFWL